MADHDALAAIRRADLAAAAAIEQSRRDERKEARRCEQCGAYATCYQTRTRGDLVWRGYRCRCGAAWRVYFRPMQFVRRVPR